ncbi:DsbA family protein [Pedobacter sp. P351]|uniref:DsbA family protein n=1 Tax=Pedobacter superstes TaxID=3133441 RepID=UPI0030ACDCF6
MKPKIIYVYDALCGWCYGFSPVIKAVYENYEYRFDFEVISGGMMLGPRTGPISVIAPYIETAYHTVEEVTGVVFGEGFLRQVEKGEMILDSEKPAIALSVFKTYYPAKAILFAHDIQNCINFDGKEPNDENMYRYLAVNFGIDPDVFIHKMHEEEFKQAAYYDFALAKQLQVSGYPAAFIQSADNNFYMIAKGFTRLEDLEARIEKVWKEIQN